MFEIILYIFFFYSSLAPFCIRAKMYILDLILFLQTEWNQLLIMWQLPQWLQDLLHVWISLLWFKISFSIIEGNHFPEQYISHEEGSNTSLFTPCGGWNAGNKVIHYIHIIYNWDSPMYVTGWSFTRILCNFKYLHTR